MTRRAYSVLLLAVALLGAGGTAFLAMSLSGGEARGRGLSARVDVARQPPRIGPAEPTAPAARREAGGSVAAGEPLPPGSHHTAVRPGLREPYDSQETRMRRAQLSSRILELLDQIMTLDKVTERHNLHTELQNALRELGGRIDPEIRDRLMKMLEEDSDPRFRPLIGQTLGALEGDAETAKRLVDLLKTRPANVYTRNAIFIALENMKVEAVVPDLLALLGEGHDNEELIVRAIGGIGGPDAQKALLQRLFQPLRPETRREIEAALGRVPDRTVLEAATAALPDADADAKASIVTMLGMTRDPRYAESVIRTLEGEAGENVRRAALRALGQFGDEKSGLTLLRYVSQGGDLARHATNALQSISNADTVTRLAEDFDRLPTEARAALMGAALRLPVPGAKLEKLALATLADGDERTRRAAIQVLGRRGRADHVEPVARAIERAQSMTELNAGMQALQSIATRSAAQAGLDRLHLLPEAQREAYRRVFERIREAAPPDPPGIAGDVR